MKGIKKIEQRNNDNNIFSFFLFYFYGEGYILLDNMINKNVVYVSYYISSKVWLSVSGYFKRRTKDQRPYRSSLVL